MEVRFTEHALYRMRVRGISRLDVQRVIEDPHVTRIGDTAIEYDGVAGGRRLRAVVARSADPALVITVFERTA